MLTDEAWIKGVARLKSTCADRQQDPAMRDTRWSEYRDQLDHLTDEQFTHAVTIGCRCEFIPSIGELLRWASELPARPPARLALDDEDAREDAREQREIAGMTPEQRRARHAELSAKFMADMERRGLSLSGVLRTMPPAKPEPEPVSSPRTRESVEAGVTSVQASR